MVSKIWMKNREYITSEHSKISCCHVGYGFFDVHLLSLTLIFVYLRS